MSRPEDWRVEFPPLQDRTLGAVVEGRVSVHPDQTAIRDFDRTLSYGQLYEESLRIAGGLANLGVGYQQPVAFMLDNHVDIVLVWFALALTGRIEVPLNTAYRGRILSHVVDNCGTRVLVIEETYADRIVDIADAMPSLETVVIRGDPARVRLPTRLKVISLEELQGDRLSPPKVQPWDLMGILYTSGTTGVSKGVRTPHALAYQCATPQSWGRPQSDDINMGVLPLFHIAGQNMSIYATMIAGASVAIMPRFSASTFWDEVRRFNCTFVLAMGSIPEFLYRQPPSPRDRDHPMRNMAISPVLPEVKDFIKRFGLESVVTCYGMTEAGFVSAVPIGAEAIPGQAGWVRPDFEARIVDENDCEVPIGQSGELLLRHRDPWSLMDGYHDMPEATTRIWRNLWLHTGDMVSLAENGQLVFRDRIKDAIRRRGENISSFEVEREIAEHPSVFECAVVAVPSDTSEDDVKACVVLKPDATLKPEELLHYLIPRLPYFMVPRYIEFVDEIPKTLTNRVRKIVLRERGVTTETWDRIAAGVEVHR